MNVQQLGAYVSIGMVGGLMTVCQRTYHLSKLNVPISRGEVKKTGAFGLVSQVALCALTDLYRANPLAACIAGLACVPITYLLANKYQYRPAGVLRDFIITTLLTTTILNMGLLASQGSCLHFAWRAYV